MKKQYILFVFTGIFLRFLVMTLGHNYDFESYCISGEIAGNLRNVYAETSRYNYGFIFFCIQGLLYRIAVLGTDSVFLYRILIVTILTFTDMGIAYIIRKKYSLCAAIFFFLNPISIIITGYHNQFDNIAVLFALWAVFFYNEEKGFSKRDVYFILLMSFSLITKHVFFLFPVFILLKRRLPVKKKICYAVLPPTIFLISFIPFVAGNRDALNGVLNNVFLYRSYNNAPLLQTIYDLTGMPSDLKFYMYIIMMMLFAFVIRERTFDDVLLLYTMALVCFSSAIANQYLSIPLAALSVIKVGRWRYIYTMIAGIYLLLQNDGFGILEKLQTNFGDKMGWGNFYISTGYTLIAWVLLFAIIGDQMYQKHK